MTRLFFTGSFDPVTYGHLDIIGRAAAFAGELIVGVAVNRSKSGLFTVEERVEILRKLCADKANVRVLPVSGLVADLARELQITAIVRSCRNASDYDYEAQMAEINKTLNPACETILLTADPKYAALSSSAVREIASFGGDVTPFVPPAVAELVQKKYSAQ